MAELAALARLVAEKTARHPDISGLTSQDRIRRIYYYSWDRSTAKFTRHTIGAVGEGIALGRQYSVVDLNGDGRLDLTAPSKQGLWLFFNQGYK